MGDNKLLLLWALLAVLCGACNAGAMGKNFVTVFMQNYKANFGETNLQVLITGYSPSTKVTITQQKTSFVKVLTVNEMQTLSVQVPDGAEVPGTGKYCNPITIQADKDISVQSVNYKKYTTDTTIVHPTQDWGTEYYVVTPLEGPPEGMKEFVVINKQEPNNIIIYLKGTVTYKEQNYPAGSTLTEMLEPYEAIQLQSNADLSGSKVVSSKPSGVMSGHTCAWKNSTCNHVYEQLLPTSSWANTFIVPAIPFQTKTDFAHITASQDTRVQYLAGSSTNSQNLVAGQVLKIEIRVDYPLYITANVGIQVLLTFTGSTARDGTIYDPFIMNIPDISSYCVSYHSYGLKEFDNYNILVAKTSAHPGVTLDKAAIAGLKWSQISGTEYSWSSYHVGKDFSINLLEDSAPFLVLSFGVSHMNGYGSPATCISNPCKSMKCRTKETCKIQNNNPVCVPDYSGTCWGWGNPHYHTFDGFNYDFQGTCTYTISKYCGSDTTMVPFAIDEKNDNRGNQVVSYVRQVNIYVYGYKISIFKGEYGKIRLDDKIISLPMSLEDDRIKVVQSGGLALLQTDFGLQVTYEWNWHLVITIPSSYYGATCGLCGNFNQNARDDMMTPDGTKAPAIIDWAKSWQVPDRDPFCFHVCRGVCPTCDESKKALYKSEQFCGIISKTSNGPFRECHSKLNPDNFADSCLYDVCINGGAKQFLCQALSVYAVTCRKAGVKIYDWRTPAGCPLPCGENSHYEACGNACPASCSNRTSPASCSMPCVETCQCNDGFVLSGDKCVPVGSCGCTDNGLYYKPNEEFWSDNNCQVRCKCDPTLGMLVCKNTQCKDSEKCMVVNGVKDCFPVSYSTCSASGDPHYTTFDGKKYDFMGTCVYQLVGLVSKDPSLTLFTITVQNNNRGNKAVSFSKVVTLKANGINISLTRDYPRMIQVNGLLTALPLYSKTSKVAAYISGGHVVIQIDFDLTITFDWDRHVTVTMPSTYTKAVGGLCGNNNKDVTDDLTMKNGAKATSVVQFANSWNVRDVSGCTPECTGSSCPLCNDAQKEKYKSEKYCGVTNKVNGPFSKCYASIDPTPFFNNCLFDTCQYKGHFSASCNAIGAYVVACQALGIQIQEWRTASFCSPSCPNNMHYEVCGNGCPATCTGLSAPVGCNALCTEGCFCNNGFILSGDKCVPIAQCGCVYNERYYKKGQEFYPDGLCKERCMCGDNRAVECKKVSCGANEQCKVVNGIHACHPVEYGKCLAAGNPHYISFDGLSFDFQGTCTYILAKVTVDDPRLEKFSVIAENESYGNGNVAVTRKVSVTVYGYSVMIERGMRWKVKVDGEFMNLPLTLNEGTIRINQKGNNIVIQTDFVLKVLYDTLNFVMVSVPSTYKGKLGGLCGNFNGNNRDMYQLPNNQITSNVKDFGAAWKVTVAGAKCTDDCQGGCPVCDAAEIAPYRGVNSCGMITNTAGPFKSCHAIVNPANYFNHCTYDLCSLEGNGDILCKSLQAYAAACQAAGITIASWRTADFCPMTCNANSHYELCTSTCDVGCAALAGPAQCRAQCFEGCECDAGYTFDGETCVSMNDCGCVYNGRYMKLDESFISADCKQKCTCSAAGGVFCEAVSCAEGEFCMLKQGVRGCFKKEGKCTMTPGPQFSSFDGMTGKVTCQGPYEVASLCDGKSAAWFRVVVDFQLCKDDGEKVASTVYVFIRDAFIAISKSKKAWRDGREISFPATISETVSVTIRGDSVVVEQASRLHVELSSSGSVTVTVNEALSNNLCGACGNFNGDKGDDLKLKDGTVAGGITDVITSWKAPAL